MKNNKFYIVLVMCSFIIALAFIKRMDFIPSSNNLWTSDNESKENTEELSNQDWTISDFDLDNRHFKLIDVVYSNHLYDMDFPGISLIDKTIVMNGEKITSDHYFVKVTYEITNKTNDVVSHGMNSFKINFYDNNVDLGLPKEFSSNSINIGKSNEKSYMLTKLESGETKKISIGMILPKNYIEQYQLVLSYNPTGSRVPRNDANEMIMNDTFRLILLDSFIKGDVVYD